MSSPAASPPPPPAPPAAPPLRARCGWPLPPVLARARLRRWHPPAQIVGGDDLNGGRGPIALLGFAATAAFEAWWRTRRRAAAAAYVVLGALCVYCHLGSAPFVVAPFVFALGGLLLEKREDRPGLGAVVAVGLAEVAAFLAFLLPARDSLRELIGDKHNPLEIVPATVSGALELQAGTR